MINIQTGSKDVTSTVKHCLGCVSLYLGWKPQELQVKSETGPCTESKERPQKEAAIPDWQVATLISKDTYI